jgi:hypothetical protein
MIKKVFFFLGLSWLLSRWCLRAGWRYALFLKFCAVRISTGQDIYA